MTPRVYLAMQLASLVVASGSILTWIARKQPFTIPQQATFFIVGVELLMLVGPWRTSVFTRWDLANIAYAMLYAVLIYLQGRSPLNLHTHRPASPAPRRASLLALLFLGSASCGAETPPPRPEPIISPPIVELARVQFPV